MQALSPTGVLALYGASMAGAAYYLYHKHALADARYTLFAKRMDEWKVQDRLWCETSAQRSIDCLSEERRLEFYRKGSLLGEERRLAQFAAGKPVTEDGYDRVLLKPMAAPVPP